MRLLDLDPKWLVKDGKRVAFTFLSPAGKRGNTHWRQSCFSIPSPPTREQWKLFGVVHGNGPCVQGCNEGIAWIILGGIDAADFATLTVAPSIDGSAGGLWHGFITNGEIK
jgi:hypothetical protein